MTSNSQTIQETKELASVSETHSESTLSKPETLEHEPSDLSTPMDKQTSLQFNESIHKENWIEDEEKIYLTAKTKKRRAIYERALDCL